MKWDHFQLDDDNVVMPICRIMQIQSSEHTHTHTNRAHLKRREKSIVKKWHTKEYERKHAHFTNC